MSRLAGLSYRKWSLLALPFIVAFVVGASVPTLFGGEFTTLYGLLWGLIIVIIDYNILLVKRLHWFVAICRILIIFCSAFTTATIGELYIFKEDVRAHIEGEYEADIRDFEVRRQTIQQQIDQYTRIRNCQDPSQPRCAGVVKGKGPVYHDAVDQIERLKKERELLTAPSISKYEGNILQKIKVIHGLVSSSGFVFFSYAVFTLLVLLIEALPILLKSAKLY